MSAVLPKLGVRLPNSGPLATARNILELATRADELGYDDVWVHDHISWARRMLTHFAAGSIEACDGQDPNLYESITTLSVLGGTLKKAGLGAAGLVLPLRDPRVLAKQIATLDNLVAPRQVTVALGIGAIVNDFEVMGVPWKRRGAITDDYLAAMAAILRTDQPVTFESSCVSWTSGEFYPRPARTNLWLAGQSDAALRRIVNYCNGWLTAFRTPDELRVLVDRVATAADGAGRSMADITTAYETFVCVGTTEAEAREISTKSIEHKFGSMEKGLSVTMVGNPDQVVDQIREYKSAGADYIELKFICHNVQQMSWMLDQIATRTVQFERSATP